MKNVTKLAKKSAGLSQKCSICPLMQRCTLEIHRACFDSFVEGFKKGARAAEKEINKKFKSIQKGTNMGKNIKGLASSTIFNRKMVEQMNGINKNNKGKASPIYIPTKKRK